MALSRTTQHRKEEGVRGQWEQVTSGKYLESRSTLKVLSACFPGERSDLLYKGDTAETEQWNHRTGADPWNETQS